MPVPALRHTLGATPEPQHTALVAKAKAATDGQPYQDKQAASCGLICGILGGKCCPCLGNQSGAPTLTGKAPDSITEVVFPDQADVGVEDHITAEIRDKAEAAAKKMKNPLLAEKESAVAVAEVETEVEMTR